MKLKFGDKRSINWLKRIKKQLYERNIEPVDVDVEEISLEECCCMSFKRKEWDLPSFLVKELLEEKKLLVWEVKCIYFDTCKWKFPARFSYFDDHEDFIVCECVCLKEIMTDLEGNPVDSDIAKNLQVELAL